MYLIDVSTRCYFSIFYWKMVMHAYCLKYPFLLIKFSDTDITLPPTHCKTNTLSTLRSNFKTGKSKNTATLSPKIRLANNYCHYVARDWLGHWYSYIRRKRRCTRPLYSPRIIIITLHPRSLLHLSWSIIHVISCPARAVLLCVISGSRTHHGATCGYTGWPRGNVRYTLTHVRNHGRGGWRRSFVILPVAIRTCHDIIVFDNTYCAPTVYTGEHWGLMYMRYITCYISITYLFSSFLRGHSRGNIPGIILLSFLFTSFENASEKMTPVFSYIQYLNNKQRGWATYEDATRPLFMGICI